MTNHGFQPRDGSEYVEFEGFGVEYRDASHRYYGWVEGERNPWVSVTSALSIIDRPALRRWQGNMDATATLELERRGELIGIPTEKAIHVVRQKGYGAEAKRDEGAARGTALHDTLRAYCTTGAVPVLGDYSEAVRGYVQALCGFLIDYSPEPELVEQVVGAPQHALGGRFDLLADINGERTLLDLKTSQKAYPEHHLQMAGYEICLKACGIEPPKRSLIISLSDSGHYLATMSYAKPEQFLAVLSAHKATLILRAALKEAA